MKMESGIIWGIIIILIGLSIILKFPVFRIIVGGVLIFIGVKVIMGGFQHKPFGRHCYVSKTENNVVFGEMKFTASDIQGKDQNVVFGQGEYDLRDVDLSQGSVNLKFHTVFGSTIIMLNKDMPYKITTNAVFGGARLPNGNTTAFGTSSYASPNYSPDSAVLNIIADVVFGGIEFNH